MLVRDREGQHLGPLHCAGTAVQVSLEHVRSGVFGEKKVLGLLLLILSCLDLDVVS